MQGLFYEILLVVVIYIGGVLLPMFNGYRVVRNTAGPKERAFVLKGAVLAAIVVAVLFGLYVGLKYALPEPYVPWRFALIPLILAYLLLSMHITGRRLAQIRAEDSPVKPLITR